MKVTWNCDDSADLKIGQVLILLTHAYIHITFITDGTEEPLNYCEREDSERALRRPFIELIKEMPGSVAAIATWEILVQ